VNADLVALVSRELQHSLVSPAYVRTGQEDAVQERADAVGRDHAGAADLAEKTRTKDAFDRAACIVGPEGEEERCLDAEFVEEGEEVRHADARAAVGVNVDLDGENGRIHRMHGHVRRNKRLTRMARIDECHV
jgi:hypothetical protein